MLITTQHIRATKRARSIHINTSPSPAPTLTPYELVGHRRFKQSGLTECLGNLLALGVADRLQGWPHNGPVNSPEESQGFFHAVVHIQKRRRIEDPNQRL